VRKLQGGKSDQIFAEKTNRWSDGSSFQRSFLCAFGEVFPVIGKVISMEKRISNPETIGSRFFYVVDLRGLTGTSFKSNVDQFDSLTVDMATQATSVPASAPPPSREALIVVSNRLPFVLKRNENGQWERKAR
jgi:hypothetical protein